MTGEKLTTRQALTLDWPHQSLSCYNIGKVDAELWTGHISRCSAATQERRTIPKHLLLGISIATPDWQCKSHYHSQQTLALSVVQ